MRVTRVYLVPALLSSFAQADLTCLGWGIVNPFLGIVCAFKPEPFQEVDQAIENTAEAVGSAVVSGVEQTAEDLRDLGEFDLTHNPVALTYNYVDTAINQGVEQANTDLVDKLDDFVDVSIGIGKTAVNTAVTILEWTNWQDFWFCTFAGAIDTSRNNTDMTSDQDDSSTSNTTLPENSVLQVVKTCAGEKFEHLTNPLVFKNITDPNQKIGGTIFDIATLLVPVGEGAVAGDAVLQGGYDLAVAGTEDSTRIVKWLKNDGEGVAGAFETEEEALAVKERLKTDPEWPKTNCATCNVKAGLGGRSVLSHRPSSSRQRRHGRRRRAISPIEICCLPDDGGHLLAMAKQTVTQPEFPTVAQAQSPAKAAYKSLNVAGELVQEANLIKPPPATLLRDISGTDGIELLREDLLDNSLGVVKWPQSLLDLEDSATFLRDMRTVFEQGDTNPLWNSLKIEKKTARAETISDRFMSTQGDALLAPIQKFAQTGMDFAVDATKRMFGSKLGTAEIEGYMEIFWTPAATAAEDGTAAALDSTTAIGGHVDPGFLIFSSADQPGLVINLAEEGQATRIIPQADTFQIIKGAHIPVITRKDPRVMRPAWHSVFGPEIAQNGRLSFLFGARHKIVAAATGP